MALTQEVVAAGTTQVTTRLRYDMMDDDTTLQELVEDLASTLGLQSTQPSKMKTSRLLARKLKMLLKRN